MVEAVAARYDFDGYGWQYIDSGSGSDWLTRHPDAEPLYGPEAADRIEQLEAALREANERMEKVAQAAIDDALARAKKQMSVKGADTYSTFISLREMDAKAIVEGVK